MWLHLLILLVFGTFVIEKIDGEHTLCGCSRVDYLDCEHYMNQSWDASGLR